MWRQFAFRTVRRDHDDRDHDGEPLHPAGREGSAVIAPEPALTPPAGGSTPTTAGLTSPAPATWPGRDRDD